MAQRRVFVAIPYRQEFADVFDAIAEAARRAGEDLQQDISAVRSDQLFAAASISAQVRQAVDDADLVIADVSSDNINVAYEIGLSQAAQKPVIIISQRDFGSFTLPREHHTVLYDPQKLSRDLVPRLSKAIVEVLRDPEGYRRQSEREEDRRLPSVFISYSHADSASLERLQVHLAPLQKKGIMQAWADTNIKAGDKWKEKIAGALDRAAIAVLLISADFLASDFITENELPPLLRAAEDKGTRILPVILKPCRSLRDENLSQFHAVNSPSTPLLSVPLKEQEGIWDEVSEAVKLQIKSRS